MKNGLMIFALMANCFPIKAQTMYRASKEVTNKELTDRIEISELISDYSRFADQRKLEKQAALFTDRATIEIYYKEPGDDKPDTILHGKKEFIAGFETLKKYDVTMHFNGQSTIYLHGNSASGEVYCLAHHLWTENGKRMLMVIGIRYYDTYVHQKNTWLFAKRKLIFDWVDKRPSVAE